MTSCLHGDTKITHRHAPIELVAAVVPELVDETHVLQQLFLYGLRVPIASQRSLVLIASLPLVHRVRPKDPLEPVDDLDRCRIRRRAIDPLPERLLALEKDGLDELARVKLGREERDRGVVGHGQGERPFAVGGGGEHLSREVGHVEAGEEVRGGDAEVAEVLLDRSLAVEVGHFRKDAFADWTHFSKAVREFRGSLLTLCDVEYAAPDGMLDVLFLRLVVSSRRREWEGQCIYLADVCNILALGNLPIAIEVLPEVGHCEHAVGALDRGTQRLLVVQVGLEGL